MTSTSRELFIEFIANSDTPGNGFRARYQFAKIVVESQFDALENFKQYFANKGEQISIGIPFYLENFPANDLSLFLHKSVVLNTPALLSCFPLILYSISESFALFLSLITV